MANETALPAGTDTVEVAFADNHGLLRGKRIPAARWPEVRRSGITLPISTLVWGARCDIREGRMTVGDEVGYPDLVVRPLPETLRPVPWRPGTVQVLGELRTEHGQEVPIDPRHALRTVLDRYAARGWTVKLALEFEFYLLDPATRRPRETEIDCYSLDDGTYEDVLAPLRNQLIGHGIRVEGSNTEYAPGQFEVNLHFDDALAAVDDGVRFRSAVKQIAARHGYLATFMAKPFDELSGSGMHVHQSLWDGGRNVFADGAGEFGLSATGRHYVAGLAAGVGELGLLGSTTPNALKRRRDGTFCPTTDAWGLDNRTVAVRVIAGGDATRVEQRDGSADANPYLAVAGQLAAGLWGIEQRLEPGPPCLGDAYLLGPERRLPTSVPEAVRRLRESKIAAGAFDPALIDTLVDTALVEHDAVTGPVSEIERARYIGVY